MMSEMKHTPAPWIQQKYGMPPNPYIIAQTCAYPSPSTTVAWGEPTGGQGWPSVGDAGVFDRETAEANARLIAAAPELLEALIMARRIIASETANEDAVELIDAAISKASA